MGLTICDSNKRICNISSKHSNSVNSAISGNSRPYNNDSDGNLARGPGFIPRRYLTSSGSTIIKPGSITHNKNISAAPNPIKHWRRQLIPRENSGTGKARVSQIMDRPGGANYITANSNNYIYGQKSINCIKTYIEANNENLACKKICVKKPKRNSISVSDNYHISSTSYLQSRVKLYDQRIATQNIPGNEYKNLSTDSSTGSQEYHSQYTTDQSGCFIDCSCVVSVIYKPNNMQFFKQGAVSSNLYTFNLRQKADNLCILRNTWGLDNVCSAKYVDNINTPDNNTTTALCKSKTNNISKRYTAGGAGHHTVCFYTPSSDLQPNLGSKLHSIRGTGTGSMVWVEKNICNICNQPRCGIVRSRGRLSCKCYELTIEQQNMCDASDVDYTGYTYFYGSEYIVNIIGELSSSDYISHIPKATLTKVIIGSNVTSIASNAFQDCSNLTAITLPDSVLSIADSAYSNCSSLTSISIPNSVISISNEAFKGCGLLESITFENETNGPILGTDVFQDICLNAVYNLCFNNIQLVNSFDWYINGYFNNICSNSPQQTTLFDTTNSRQALIDILGELVSSKYLGYKSYTG